MDNDLIESTQKPNVHELFHKIKDWHPTALRGFARNLRIDQEILDYCNTSFRKDKDTGCYIDEIMSTVYGDTWERELLFGVEDNDMDEYDDNILYDRLTFNEAKK